MTDYEKQREWVKWRWADWLAVIVGLIGGGIVFAAKVLETIGGM